MYLLFESINNKRIVQINFPLILVRIMMIKTHNISVYASLNGFLSAFDGLVDWWMDVLIDLT